MLPDVMTRWLSYEDLPGKTVSYAQNHEDILLRRVFGKGYSGYYVDVGANDPVFHSVTKLLYDEGWRGINIEPTPRLHARLQSHRPEDLNLHQGVSDAAGVLTFFEVAPPLHGWSTFMPEMAASYREQGVVPVERPIAVTSLSQVFDDHVSRTVDVLKVDVEGLEREVIAGMDFCRFRPRVVLVEATWREYWEGRLFDHDYRHAAFDGINRYYVRGEDASMLPAFEAPVNVLDDFISHENLRLMRPDVADIGPTAIAFARGLRHAAHRTPRLARVLKRAWRRSS